MIENVVTVGFEIAVESSTQISVTAARPTTRIETPSQNSTPTVGTVVVDPLKKKL